MNCLSGIRYDKNSDKNGQSDEYTAELSWLLIKYVKPRKIYNYIIKKKLQIVHCNGILSLLVSKGLRYV